jgi:hypothetical protein
MKLKPPTPIDRIESLHQTFELEYIGSNNKGRKPGSNPLELGIPLMRTRLGTRALTAIDKN